MKTGKLFGYFVVREFGTNRLKADEEAIKFSATFTEQELPAELAHRARKFTNKNNEERFAVEFKITNNARWFNKFGKACERPTNAEIENVRNEVVIDYKDVVAKEKYNKEKGKFNADGLYVNALMFNPIIANPFEGEAFEAEPQAETPPPAQEEAQEVKQIDNNGDLPF